MMSLVEKAYNKALDEMSGMERLQRTLSLFSFVYEMLEHQISAECPDIDEWELKCRIAERLYMSDPAALRLIDKAREQHKIKNG